VPFPLGISIRERKTCQAVLPSHERGFLPGKGGRDEEGRKEETIEWERANENNRRRNCLRGYSM